MNLKNLINYPKEVLEIHNEFEIAGQKIIEEANKVLSETKEINTNKLERLKKLGFIQSSEVKNNEEKLNKINFSKEQKELVDYYSKNYPFNKFITEQQVKAICEKYNLICGDVSKFRGFIPEKNLSEIESFKVKEEDSNIVEIFNSCVAEGSLGYFDKDDVKAGYGDFHIIVAGRKKGFLSEKVYNRIMDSYRELWNIVRPRHSFKSQTCYVNIEDFEEPKLKICAPIKDMDTQDMNIVGHKLVKHIPDPVVLQPVKGGYLIVTKWGDEANDPIVQNQIDN